MSNYDFKEEYDKEDWAFIVLTMIFIVLFSYHVLTS